MVNRTGDQLAAQQMTGRQNALVLCLVHFLGFLVVADVAVLLTAYIVTSALEVLTGYGGSQMGLYLAPLLLFSPVVAVGIQFGYRQQRTLQRREASVLAAGMSMSFYFAAVLLLLARSVFAQFNTVLLMDWVGQFAVIAAIGGPVYAVAIYFVLTTTVAQTVRYVEHKGGGAR